MEPKKRGPGRPKLEKRAVRLDEIAVGGMVKGRSGNLNQFGYEKYTQDSEEHQQGFIVALNNRFPNLVGFGIYQYLKQVMALNPRAKILWRDDNIKKLSLQMNVEESLLRDVVNFCRKELQIFFYARSVDTLRVENLYYLIYPNFMQELIDIEVKRIMREAESYTNELSKKNPKEAPTAKDIKKDMVAKMNEFLEFTPEIREYVISYYPKLGTPDNLWQNFIEDVDKNYLKWESLLTKDNYSKMFYIYLNNSQPSDEEFLSGRI